MDFFKKIKQKACRAAYEHLVSTKPARLVFFSGGEAPDSERDQAEAALDHSEELVEERAELKLEEQFTQIIDKTRELLETTFSEDNDITPEELRAIQLILQHQVDERLQLREDHLEAATTEPDPVEEPPTVEAAPEKTPKQLREELLTSGHIKQIKAEGYFRDMAANNGMSYQQLKELNDRLSPKFNLKEDKGWCYGSDIVYAYTSPEKAAEAELILGFRETPQTVVANEDVARAALEGQAYDQAQEAEMFGRDGARVESTRQSLLSQKGLGSARRRESLRGTLLSRQSRLTLDDSLENPFERAKTLGIVQQNATWEDFKTAWETVDGASAVNTWLSEQATFTNANYGLDKYLFSLAQREGRASDMEDVSFNELIDSVYGTGMSGESLIVALAAQNGVEIDRSFRDKKRRDLTPEDKYIRGLLRNIKGDFRNDYDRMLDTLTLEVGNKEYVGNGLVEVTLQKPDGTESITAKIPIEHVIEFESDVLLEDMEESEIQIMIDRGRELPIFVGPNGNLLALDGTDLSGNITEGNFENLTEEYRLERAIVQAMETIYQDVAELYDRTADLNFVDAGTDESYRSTRSRVEAFRGLDDQNSAAVANFGVALDSALVTGEYEGRNRESLGFIRRGGEVTYEDVETGRKFIVTNEDIFDYYDGAAVVDDILDQFLEQKVSASGTQEVFHLGRGLQYLNDTLIRTALITNQALIDKHGGDSEDPQTRFETAFEALKVTKANILPNEGEELTALTPDQITLIQEGYMIHSALQEAKQVTEGREAVETLEHAVELTIDLPEEVIAGLVEGIIAQYPQYDSPKDRAIIAGRCRAGIHFGTLTTKDLGSTHTTTTITKVDGEVIDITRETETVREAGTLDGTRLTIGLGVNPINVSGLGPDGRGTLNIGFAGSVNLLSGNASASMGARYSVEFKNGVQAYVDGGFGMQAIAIGGGVIIPAGEARIDLHGHVYPGGFEVGGAVTFGNLENSYNRDLSEAFEANGFKNIDAALQAANGAPTREVVDQILANPDFAEIADYIEQIYQAFSDGNTENVRDDEVFQEFVLALYRHQRSQRASEVLHGTASNPLDPANITVAASLNVDIKRGGFCISPMFGIGTVAHSQSLTFRSPTGIHYADLADKKMVADLLGKEFDVTKEVMSGRVPQLVPDPDNPEKMILAFDGDAHEGILLNPDNLNEYNSDLSDDNLYLQPTQLAYRANEGDEVYQGRTVMELTVADANGSLDIIVDPAIEGSISTLFGLGEGTDPDRYFLAFAPGTDVVLRRTNLHYPQKKSGAYERTVVVITQPGSAKTYDQLMHEGAPMLHRAAGSRTVADMAGSNYLLNEGPVMTAGHYMQLPESEQADWTGIARSDLMAQEYMEMLGSYPSAGLEIDPEQFKSVAQELMAGDPDPNNGKFSPHREFRIKFKDLSTLGAHPDLTKLTELCREKSAEMFGKALEGAALTNFIQTLAIFSFYDLHREANDESTSPERREQLLKEQQRKYDYMLHHYMKSRLTTEFNGVRDESYTANTDAMVRFIIERLEIPADQWELFGQEGAELPEGGIFGSIVGTDGIAGIHITENYRAQDFYETLNLTGFNLQSGDPIERDVAKAVITLLNPLPKATKMTIENLDQIHDFVTDDFTQKIMMVWGYRNQAEGQTLKALSEKVFGEGNSKENLQEALEGRHGEYLLGLLNNVQNFVTEARAAELAGTERIALGNGNYLSFRQVEASFFVFQRCGNVSPYLNETLTVENDAGQVVAVANDTHVSVQAQGAERQLIVGAGVTSRVQCVGEHTNEVIIKDTPGKEPHPVNPSHDQTGTGQQGTINVGEIRDGVTPGHGDDNNGEGNPMGN